MGGGRDSTQGRWAPAKPPQAAPRHGRHTEYRGDFKGSERPGRFAPHRVVKWFWEWVETLSQADRQRLLRFATGTSGVPVGGFRRLQVGDA